MKAKSISQDNLVDILQLLLHGDLLRTLNQFTEYLHKKWERDDIILSNWNL